MLTCAGCTIATAPGVAGRRAFRGLRWAGVLALCGTVVLTGCEVRRTLVPESTHQLRVVETRRLVERPALSPAAWSPDGRRVAYGTPTGMWVTSLDGGERQLLEGGPISAVSWSRVLDLLAVIDRGTVWTMRPDGTDRHRLTLGGVAAEVAWAPGSDRLAVILLQEVDRDARFELWLTTRDGGLARMVVRAPKTLVMRELQWFPDSLYLFYGLSAPGDVRIIEAWRVRIAYPDRQRIALTTPARFLRLAPSGRLVAYLSDDEVADGRGRILVVRTDGSGRVAVTPEVRRVGGVAWSPQGDKVAFAEVRSATDADLWMADADGSDRVHVFAYTLEMSDPQIALSIAWSPDGRHLVFGTNTGTFRGPIWLSTFARR